jgi:hypothetical protein
VGFSLPSTAGFPKGMDIVAHPNKLITFFFQSASAAIQSSLATAAGVWVSNRIQNAF